MLSCTTRVVQGFSMKLHQEQLDSQAQIEDLEARLAQAEQAAADLGAVKHHLQQLHTHAASRNNHACSKQPYLAQDQNAVYLLHLENVHLTCRSATFSSLEAPRKRHDAFTQRSR